MNELIWYNNSLLLYLLLPFSWLYGIVSGFIRLCYKLGWKKSWRAPVPIVVVGNITVGGSGKTPVVIWLVEQLQRHGIRVGVVARGYRGRALYYPLLLNPQTTTAEAGDEPVLIYNRTHAPVAVAPNRSKAVQALLNKYPLQIIITDDGLQHYALARDIEIVVINNIRNFGNGWLIPAGPMRERVSRLRSVDAIIINGGIGKNGEIAMQLHSRLAVNLLTGENRDVSKLNNLIAMAGIGYPLHFFTTLKLRGAKLVKCISLSDHKTLSFKKINKLALPEETLIMTEKDAVKYRVFARKNWWYLPIDVELEANKSNILIKRLIYLAKNNTKNAVSL